MLMFKAAFSLFCTIDQSACRYSCLSVEQPIRFWLSVVYASLGISNTRTDNFNVNMPYWCTVLVLYIFICSCNCFIPMLLATPMSMYCTQQNQALVLYLHSVRRCDSSLQLSLLRLASINCLMLQNAIHPKQWLSSQCRCCESWWLHSRNVYLVVYNSLVLNCFMILFLFYLHRCGCRLAEWSGTKSEASVCWIHSLCVYNTTQYADSHHEWFLLHSHYWVWSRYALYIQCVCVTA